MKLLAWLIVCAGWLIIGLMGITSIAIILIAACSFIHNFPESVSRVLDALWWIIKLLGLVVAMAAYAFLWVWAEEVINRKP